MQRIETRTALITVGCVVSGMAMATAAMLLYQALHPYNEIPKGWSTIDGSVDQWTSWNGKIRGHTSTGESLLVSTKEYRDVTVSAYASTTNREASLAVRMEDADNGYIAIFGPGVIPAALAHGLFLIRRIGGQDETIGVYRGRILNASGASAKLTLKAKGPWLEVFLNNKSVIRVKDKTFSSGFIGQRMYGTEEYPCDAAFFNLTF
jgi:hypothetical protein